MTNNPPASPDYTPPPIWRTTAVTSLAEPLTVTLADEGEEYDYTAPPVALLQENTSTGSTRVVLGVLNPDRGEIEPVDPDEQEPCRLGYIVEIFHSRSMRLGPPQHLTDTDGAQ